MNPTDFPKHIQDPNKKTHALCGQPILEVERWSHHTCPNGVDCKICKEKLHNKIRDYYMAQQIKKELIHKLKKLLVEDENILTEQQKQTIREYIRRNT